MGKAFSNKFKTSFDSFHLIKILENASTNNAESIADEKEFVIEKHDGSYFKLLSAEYLRKHPDGKICPTLELVVKDNTEGDGSVMEYKIDLQKNLVSVLTVILIVCALIGSFLLLICSLFVTKSILGDVAGLVLLGASGTLLVKIAIIPVFGMLTSLSKVVINSSES